MKKTFVIITVLLGIFLVAFFYRDRENLTISSFEECVKYFATLESYPRQCIDSEGNHFVEYIGNILEKNDLVKLENIYPNQEILRPLVIKGEARGFWFFEASFPVKLYDEDNNLIATSFATAQGEWMTEEFVKFEAEISFVTEAQRGYLVLEKDNPSGLEENYDELKIPINFKK